MKDVHLFYRSKKPETTKTLYEKIFFDNIHNKIEAERLEKPIVPDVTHERPHAVNKISIGKKQFYANSKGQLNSESTLVNMENKLIFPPRPIYEMPDLARKTEIVHWNSEPFDNYRGD